MLNILCCLKQLAGQFIWCLYPEVYYIHPLRLKYIIITMATTAITDKHSG